MKVAPEALSEVRQTEDESSIAFRIGCYDLLHDGHYEGLLFAKAQAELLVVGVMPDELIRRRKGPDRPIRPEADRIDTIDQMDSVDYSFIIPTSILECGRAMLRLRPDVYVEHAEHNGDGAMFRLAFRLLGATVVIDPLPKIGSTTDIIRSMRAGASEGLPST